MLQSSPKTGCQQFVIWVTDEAHGDNDVRCEPGYYVQTDDGTEYVPGRLCDFVSTYETLIGIVQANTRNNDVSISLCVHFYVPVRVVTKRQRLTNLWRLNFPLETL